MSRKALHAHHLTWLNTVETADHIKWCRRNLGERGKDWDFIGTWNMTIVIYNEKYVPFYKLKFD
jgi:hypothetical protein